MYIRATHNSIVATKTLKAKKIKKFKKGKKRKRKACCIGETKKKKERKENS